MEEKIRQLAESGFDSNRIAAMLMIHKHKVDDVLNQEKQVSPVIEETIIEEEPVIAKKTKRKKIQIEDETL